MIHAMLLWVLVIESLRLIHIQYYSRLAIVQHLIFTNMNNKVNVISLVLLDTEHTSVIRRDKGQQKESETMEVHATKKDLIVG